MKLIVNGEDLETSAATVKELLDEVAVRPERVAVEVNLSVVKRAEYSSFGLKEGDRVEIVNFVGGGSMGRKGDGWKIDW
ncbi:MAG: sulfur carrier protein ThiS [Thermodesulfovibrionales bacterium]|jgi:thiamine biosynthesis protein ThiS